MAVEVVQARYTVAGDVSSFDRAAFKVKLAAQLPGVSESNISVVVEAASVHVTASIATPSAQQSATISALTLLAADTSAASTALGVTVEAASTPVVTQMMLAPPGPSLSDDTSDAISAKAITGLSQGALVSIIVGAVVVALLLVAACVVCRLKGRGCGAAKPPTATKETSEVGIVYRGSVVPPPPPDVADAPAAEQISKV